MVTLTTTDRAGGGHHLNRRPACPYPLAATMRTRTTSTYALTTADIRMTALFVGRPRCCRREGGHPCLEEQPAAAPLELAGDASR